MQDHAEKNPELMWVVCDGYLKKTNSEEKEKSYTYIHKIYSAHRENRILIVARKTFQNISSHHIIREHTSDSA